MPSMPRGKLPGVIDLLAARLVRQLLLSRLSCVHCAYTLCSATVKLTAADGTSFAALGPL